MRRTLPTRRESASSPTGDAYTANEGWIRDGLVSDKDPLPWLRAVQMQGFELSIIGSTVDAVKTAVEAWHAGFKPVVIIMEDQLAPNDEQEVRKLMNELIKGHGGHGMFSYGPTPIYSDSSKCLVQLDEKGRAVDVCVCTNFGGLNSLAETWQLFKGPAIVVDPIGVNSDDYAKETTQAESQDESGRRSLSVMVHDPSQKGEPTAKTPDERRRLFLSRVKQERSAVIDPTFWEDRYDPERLSFWVIGYNETIPNLFIGLVQMFLIIGVHRWYEEKHFPIYRGLVDVFMEAPCANALIILYANAIGLHLRGDKPSPMGYIWGTIYWLLNVLPMLGLYSSSRFFASDFTCSFMGLMSVVIGMPAFAMFVKRIKVTKAMFLWYNWTVLGTLGTWIASILIMLIYLTLLTTKGGAVIASVFLTVAFSGWELLQVKLLTFFYDLFVWKPRKENPCNVLGDQKAAMIIAVGMIHSFTEVGRLTSMVVGSVRATDANYLRLIVVSVVSGLFLNTVARTGWLSCGLARVVRGCPRRALCPTAVMGLHTDVKFAMGWPRFFYMFGLLLGRGVIHDKWGFDLLDKDPGVWCWNGIVLITMAMVFAQELLEDYLVYIITQRAPAPFWETFKTEMLDRFDRPTRDDIYHPCHFLVPQSAFLAPSADSRSVPSLTSSEVNKRISKASSKRSEISKVEYDPKVTRISKCAADLAPKLSVSPNFKHTRYVTALQLQGPVGGMIVMMITCMSVGLGNCSLFGWSGPIEFDSEGAARELVLSLLRWNANCTAA